MADSEEQVLVASVHDVRQLTTILRGVNIYGRAILSISEAGLNVVVEEARTMVASAYIPLSIFDEFKYVPDPEESAATQASESNDGISATSIDIPLDTLIECLNIFGTATTSSTNSSQENSKKKWKQGSDEEDERGRRGKGKRRAEPKDNTTIDQFFPSRHERRTGMRMSYAGTGHPLKLILDSAEDASGPTTTCEIQTMESEPFIDLPFDASRKVINTILQSSWLRDALSELDPSCDKLTFIATPISATLPEDIDSARKAAVKPRLRLSAEGTFGSTQMDYPNDRYVLETFECAVPVKFTYRVALIKSALRALQTSSKTSLRIDDEGLLSLQFMMANNVFIEFKCLSMDDEV